MRCRTTAGTHSTTEGVMRADSSACLRGERLSWSILLTAAALPGLGATVTSHPRDILKGGSQQGDEV